MTGPSAARRTPRILVLLATHNGAEFLDAQLDSILEQRDVEVRVLACDDASVDATRELLRRRAERDPRVTLLPGGTFGSAAANFFHLIQQAPADGVDAIGLSDQDDIWHANKLDRHARLLLADHGIDGGGPYDAVSSNVVAFDTAGHRVLVQKNQPQQEADFAFESGGPGSTFLLRPEAFRLVQGRLRDPDSAARRARSHDWLIYALVRAAGGRWFIDGEATVEYRQHGANELGANEGLRQNLRRLQQIASRRHRDDAQRIIAAAREVATPSEHVRLDLLAELTARTDLVARLRLARLAPRLRRRRRDRLALAATILTGLW